MQPLCWLQRMSNSKPVISHMCVHLFIYLIAKTYIWPPILYTTKTSMSVTFYFVNKWSSNGITYRILGPVTPKGIVAASVLLGCCCFGLATNPTKYILQCGTYQSTGLLVFDTQFGTGRWMIPLSWHRPDLTYRCGHWWYIHQYLLKRRKENDMLRILERSS